MPYRYSEEQEIISDMIVL